MEQVRLSNNVNLGLLQGSASVGSVDPSETSAQQEIDLANAIFAELQQLDTHLYGSSDPYTDPKVAADRTALFGEGGLSDQLQDLLSSEDLSPNMLQLGSGILSSLSSLYDQLNAHDDANTILTQSLPNAEEKILDFFWHKDR